jgi:signal transduction histidine kinase
VIRLAVVDHVPADIEHTLHARLVAAVEAERARIARELHDVVGQALTAVRLNLLALEAPASDGGGPGIRLASSIAVIDDAINQVRLAAFELRPDVLDDLGLPAALRALGRSVAERAGVNVACRIDTAGSRLPAEVETTCFRVAQEALTNAIRHAGARHITIRLAVRGRPRMVVLEVVDDGAGFDPGQCSRGRCLGIQGMRERASLAGGTFEVRSTPGGGTSVVARLPLGPDGGVR